jgi:hypothetical protein
LEDNVVDSEEETRALGLALEINNSFDELQKAAAVLRPAQERLEASLVHKTQAQPTARRSGEETQADLEKRYSSTVESL